jgi:glycine cleavage system aminomethyltransferase T
LRTRAVRAGPAAIVSSEPVAAATYPVLQGGEQVGKVTSACHSPRLQANIGYAMLPTGLAEPLGQEFEVETPTGRQRGVTVRKPFIDPEREIPKQ